MNYYPFHLGDYAAHTGHLEPMEDLAYRRLLDVYYMREGALPADIQVTAKLVRLRSCAADVESVLNEFFVLTEEGWRHQRCEHEIAKMQDKQAKARASAQASVNSRRAKAERPLEEQQTDVERSLPASQADVQLPTPTPTPTPVVEEKTRKRATPPSALARPDDVEEQTWKDWLQLRNGKRAAVTETVLNEARREATKAAVSLDRFLSIWCARGSQGLEADWLKPHERGTASNVVEPEWRAEQRRRTQQAAPGVAARKPADQFFLEVEATNVTPRRLG